MTDTSTEAVRAMIRKLNDAEYDLAYGPDGLADDQVFLKFAEAADMLEAMLREREGRPQNRIARQFDSGQLDEVVTDGGAHLERLQGNRWFLNCIRADGSSYAVWFNGKVKLTEEREPPRRERQTAKP